MGRLVVKFEGTAVQALLTKQAIQAWRHHKMELTRGFTITMAMKLAAQYTGGNYSRFDYEKAEMEMDNWIEKNSKFVPTM